MKKFREMVLKNIIKEDSIEIEPKQKFKGTPQQFLRSIGVKIKNETPYQDGFILDFYNDDYAKFAYEDLNSVNFSSTYNFELNGQEINITY